MTTGPASARAATSLLPASWRVELPEFEGPLDLLLHLVRINEIEITDIPVALICDQFHEYLGLLDELDLDIAAEYIYEAAVLIQLKARVLLPQPEPAPGEEPEDPRRDLIERLLEYQRLKEAAQTLAEVDDLRHGLWTRGARENVGPGEDDEFDMGDLSLYDLLQVLRGVLKRHDEEHPSPLIYEGETFTVRGQIERLLSRFEGGRSLDSEGRPVRSVEPGGSDRVFPGRAGDGPAQPGPAPRIRRRRRLPVPHHTGAGSGLAGGFHRMTDRAEMEAVFEALLFASPNPQPEAKLLEVFPKKDGELAGEALGAVLDRYRMDDTGGQPNRGWSWTVPAAATVWLPGPTFTLPPQVLRGGRP